MTPVQWKKVLLIPGAEGGKVYWRVVGTTSNGAQSTSDKRSLLISAPQPVGNPVISPVSRNTLPVLTWQNRCNVKFRVWFGSDAGFSRKIILPFHVSDLTLNGGTFSKELTQAQWLTIRMLVGNEPGSIIYWYVESWDGLNRDVATEVMSFILTQ